MYFAIKDRERLALGEGLYGGAQKWFADEWRKRSGCGPVCGSNIFWYFSRKSEVFAPLCNFSGDVREQFLALMNEMFECITPGPSGVDSSKIFIDGALKYAQNKGFALDADALEIPRKCKPRPSADEVGAFIGKALESDAPVAFLNLSNGEVEALESWHWVTILALETDTMQATISDQGAVFSIDLKLWLESSLLGGVFVRLTPIPA